MKQLVVRPALAFMVVAALLMGSAHAEAQPTEAGGKPAKTKPKKKVAKTAVAGQGGTVKFMPGSGETAQQRSMRLKRECKGRVNAGACEGYTR